MLKQRLLLAGHELLLNARAVSGLQLQTYDEHIYGGVPVKIFDFSHS
jgi:hypothetical protein